MAWRDDWPLGPDGKEFAGKQLMDLVRNNSSPFRASWDVQLLIQEIEDKLRTEVTDIPMVHKGSNNYTSSRPDLLARLARGDVNMPGFDGFPIEKQVPEALFEAAVYTLLRSEPDIRASHLLYYRPPKQNPGPRPSIPRNLNGRRLFVFERAAGCNNVWDGLNAKGKFLLLDQLAHIRAALFRYHPPVDFATRYLHDRIFGFKPDSFDLPPAPTREFWVHVLESKIQATIRDQGDMIGWEDDEETVGPVALKAKHSLLRAVPLIMPKGGSEASEASLYRHVLEHGDFGIHNISTTGDMDGDPLITSLYDWETACIVPAILSDPLVAAGPVDLVVDEDGVSCVTRIPKNSSKIDLEEYGMWAHHYIEKLYAETFDYKVAVRTGKHVRHLWFALRDWRGGNSEKFFGDLGIWAEQQIREVEKLQIP
ncbi:MAG: hypothetical protein Q9215_008095, partial [Flavoplaca cf. flavocitrina]